MSLSIEQIEVASFETTFAGIEPTIDSDKCVSPLCMTEGRECTTPWCKDAEPVPVTGFAPPAGTPDPGTAQAIAAEMVAARGWGPAEFDCLVALWNKESGWNVYAMNRSSGAYGIPQSLPGNKMASAGPDWATNPATQITWGLNYIRDVYGTPCAAWGHSESHNWY